jgi:hypothetical protein
MEVLKSLVFYLRIYCNLVIRTSHQKFHSYPVDIERIHCVIYVSFYNYRYRIEVATFVTPLGLMDIFFICMSADKFTSESEHIFRDILNKKLLFY